MINGFNGKMLEYVGQVAFSAGRAASLDLPADRVIKDIHLVVRGRLNATFTGSTPVVRFNGAADGLLKRISVQRRGGDDLRTYLGTRQLVNDQRYGVTDRGAVLWRVNATTLGTATSGDRMLFGTTGQDVAFYESYVIGMENKKSSEYWRTYFSTLGNRSAKVLFDFGLFNDVLDPEDASTTPVITGDVVIDVYISKADHLIGISDTFWDFKHSYDQIVLNGAANRSRYTIQPEGELQGFWITAVKGAKETPLSHEELLKTVMEFKYDGETFFNGDLLDFAAINMNNAPILDLVRGSCYVPLLNNKTWGTGLYTGQGSSTKAIEVFITSDPAMSYTGGVKFIFEYDRVIQPKEAEVAKK